MRDRNLTEVEDNHGKWRGSKHCGQKSGNTTGKMWKAGYHVTRQTGLAGRVTSIVLTCFLLGSETTEDFEEKCAKVGWED